MAMHKQCIPHPCPLSGPGHSPEKRPYGPNGKEPPVKMASGYLGPDPRMNRPPQKPARKHHRREVRWLFLALGLGFVALGVAGIFLPLLPTTPFLLLATACFARSSERFYHWLLNHRVLGATVREWQQHRSIPRRTKWIAIMTMATTLAVSVVFFVPHAALQLALALFGVALAIYLYRIPSRN